MANKSSWGTVYWKPAARAPWVWNSQMQQTISALCSGSLAEPRFFLEILKLLSCAPQHSMILITISFYAKVLVFYSPLLHAITYCLMPVIFCVWNGASFPSLKDSSQLNSCSHFFLMRRFKLRNPSFSNHTSAMKFCHACCRERSR